MPELYRLKFGKDLPERHSSIGITHDIGKIIILKHFPDRFDAAIAYTRDHPEADFYQSELSLGFEGTTHAEIGAFFLDLWGFPESSIEACLYHHALPDDQKGNRDILETCGTADMLSNYVVSRPDAADEDLPFFLKEYANKDEIRDLVIRLKNKWENLEKNI